MTRLSDRTLRKKTAAAVGMLLLLSVLFSALFIIYSDAGDAGVPQGPQG